jgi:hypothetical protein
LKKQIISLFPYLSNDGLQVSIAFDPVALWVWPHLSQHAAVQLDCCANQLSNQLACMGQQKALAKYIGKRQALAEKGIGKITALAKEIMA